MFWGVAVDATRSCALCVNMAMGPGWWAKQSTGRALWQGEANLTRIHSARCHEVQVTLFKGLHSLLSLSLSLVSSCSGGALAPLPERD